MVERLKAAIEKARAQRGEAPAPAAQRGDAGHAPVRGSDRGDAWDLLPTLAVDAAQLRDQRIVAYDRADPSHVVFDVLRTRLTRVCREHGWTRIAITSPTAGCGKSTVALNLAFSFARQPDLRVVLIDLDLKRPRIARLLGQSGEFTIRDALTGEAAMTSALAHVADGLAVGLNTRVVRDSAELAQSQAAAAALREMIDTLQPDLVLYDLPPIFAGDDAIGFMPNVDCAMLVVAAGQTRAREIADCERLLSEATTFLGVVLNKCEQAGGEIYADGYA